MKRRRVWGPVRPHQRVRPAGKRAGRRVSGVGSDDGDHRPGPNVSASRSTSSAASMRGRPTIATSACRVATPRRCSPCSCWPAGRAHARRSPPTCGRTPDGASAGSLRQALWLVRQGLAEAGIAPDERARHRRRHGRDPDRCPDRPRRDARSRPAWPTTRAAPRPPSSSTTATCSRASATTASPPSASDCPTATRTPWRSSPSGGSTRATWSARARPPIGCSSATPCARRRTRC